MDLYAPLLHEFTYQAMCNDLLDIENGTKYRYALSFAPDLGARSRSSLLRYTFQNESGKIEDKEATLTDEDKVWTEVRHMHMKDALDKLIADFKAYAGEHGGKFGGEGCVIPVSSMDTAHADPLQQWNEPQRHEGHAGKLASAQGGEGEGELRDAVAVEADADDNWHLAALASSHHGREVHGHLREEEAAVVCVGRAGELSHRRQPYTNTNLPTPV